MQKVHGLEGACRAAVLKAKAAAALTLLRQAQESHTLTLLPGHIQRSRAFSQCGGLHLWFQSYGGWSY